MKRIKSAIIIVAILAVAVLTLTACSMNYDKYDNNAALTGKGDTTLSYGSVESNVGGNRTWSVQSFGGIKTLYEKDITENETLAIELTYTEGKLKIIAVNEDNEIFKLIENESCTELKTELAAGSYRIRLVGDDAKFEIKYTK